MKAPEATDCTPNELEVCCAYIQVSETAIFEITFDIYGSIWATMWRLSEPPDARETIFTWNTLDEIDRRIESLRKRGYTIKWAPHVGPASRELTKCVDYRGLKCVGCTSHINVDADRFMLMKALDNYD